jgi:hypothetical protein
MNRIVSIIVLVCLAFACTPSYRKAEPPTIQAAGPTNAWRSEKKPSVSSAPPVPVALLKTQESSPVAAPVETLSSSTAQGLELGDTWPSGLSMQSKAQEFLATGFMNSGKPIGFGDLAYTDAFLDFSLDTQGRIDRLDGVVSNMYDKYSYGIPVVQRGIDAISGSRQVNWEDVIVQLDAGRWSVQPVSRKGGEPFEVILQDGIEFRQGIDSIRITKTGTVFSCTYSRVVAGGQEQRRLSWTLVQYEPGPVRGLESAVVPPAEVPVVMVWEPGFLAGYLVSLPEGQAEYVHTLKLVPSGDLETDRYNFLVLLTQHRGTGPRIMDSLGAVDPVWLALLMYDHVVSP